MKPLSDQQSEQLSAYLDKQLSASDQAALEHELASDQALAAELRELQVLRSVLNDLPPVRPPRSFTLDPAVYAPRRQTWSWMRWATVLGAFVLMLTVGFTLSNVGGNQAPQSAPAMSAAGQANSEAASRLAAPTTAAAATAAPAAAAPNQNAAAATEAPAAEAMPTDAMALKVVGTEVADPAAAMPMNQDPMNMDMPPAGTSPVGASGVTSSQPFSVTNNAGGAMAFEQSQATIDRTDTSSPDTRDLMQQPVTLPAEPSTRGISLGWLFLMMLVIGVALAAMLLRTMRSRRR